MTVRIDRGLCLGCGLCADMAPEVFEMGDFVASVTSPRVPTDRETDVRGAAEDCPSAAIVIEG